MAGLCVWLCLRLPENPRSKTERLAVDGLIRIVVMRRPADVFALRLRNQHRLLPEARRAQQNPAVAAHGLHARIVLPNGLQAAFDAAVGQSGSQLLLQRGKPLDFLLHFGAASVVGILRGQQEQRGNGGDSELTKTSTALARLVLIFVNPL